MFYEEKKISNISNCSKCNERLDDPRLLPCGETICFRCKSSIQVDTKQFKCIVCDKTHSMPDEGLPVNKAVLALLSSQPREVYRSPSVAELKKRLNSMRKKSVSLTFGINNGAEKIRDVSS